MNGLLGWVVCAANADATETLDSMMQAAHVETALNVSASSSPASLASSQTHSPVCVHSAGSIIAALLPPCSGCTATERIFLFFLGHWNNL